MQKYMAGSMQNAWSNFGPFKNTLLFGTQCLNSQCRKVSTLEKKRAAGSTREALLSEAGFEKVSGPRIGSVGGSCFR